MPVLPRRIIAVGLLIVFLGGVSLGSIWAGAWRRPESLGLGDCLLAAGWVLLGYKLLRRSNPARVITVVLLAFVTIGSAMGGVMALVDFLQPGAEFRVLFPIHGWTLIRTAPQHLLAACYGAAICAVFGWLAVGVSGPEAGVACLAPDRRPPIPRTIVMLTILALVSGVLAGDLSHGDVVPVFLCEILYGGTAAG